MGFWAAGSFSLLYTMRIARSSRLHGHMAGRLCLLLHCRTASTNDDYGDCMWALNGLFALFAFFLHEILRYRMDNRGNGYCRVVMKESHLWGLQAVPCEIDPNLSR